MGEKTDKEVQDGLFKGLGAIVFAGLLVTYLICTNAFISHQYYNWFVQPKLNTPEYTLIQFIGFSLFIKAFIPSRNEWLKEEYKDENRFIKSLILPWVFYIIGMLFHSIAQ